MITGRLSRFSFAVDNFGTNPSDTCGTSLTPGTSNGEGTYASIVAAANVTEDLLGFYIRVAAGATSAQQKDHLLDIGIDPAGGSSYTTIIANLVCGESAVVATAAFREYLFPLRIPSGSTIAARLQGNNATAGTVIVSFRGYGKPSGPHLMPVGAYSETVGTITNSGGVSFTPGNAADGTYADLGTTVKDLWWWQLGYQVSNGTITGENCFIELAHGDASNKHTIMRLQHRGLTSETVSPQINPNVNPYECYCPVLAGTHIYVRGRCENAPDTGYNAVAVGIGG